MKFFIYIIIFLLVIAAVFFIMRGRGERFEIPSGEAEPISEEAIDTDSSPKGLDADFVPDTSDNQDIAMTRSTRQIFVTDGVKHSIPTDEILSGGPGKDGIPSIDDPKFISTQEADAFLNDDSIGLGFVWKGEVRFYPYQILVWHELVNDVIAGDPILISYCPLCATGIVFEGRVDGKPAEFGVSGLLWKSNLLMYNRTDDPDKESLWSQVLGEAVLGEFTGDKLRVLSADTVKYDMWKKTHPETKVLSRDTGTARNYGRDPYGNYYTDRSVRFGASFSDTRLHPKEFVLGIEFDGQFKAYQKSALPIGTLEDTFAGLNLKITKNELDEVRIVDGDGNTVRIIGGFWFSWLAVHPDTELYPAPILPEPR